MGPYLAAFLRGASHLPRCLSRSLDSTVGSNTIDKLIAAKRPRVLRACIRPSTWEHVHSDLCSPELNISHSIVRPVAFPRSFSPMPSARLLVSPGQP